MRVMKRTVTDWTREGSASRTCTVHSMRMFDAPIICAASILPGDTALMLVSTRRAKKGTAPTTSGTTVAFQPSELPTTSRVKGMRAMRRIMNGKERTTLTTKPTAWFSAALGFSPDRELDARSSPKGRPNNTVSALAQPTMRRVSRTAGQNFC